jgi:hypothetical protein
MARIDDVFVSGTFGNIVFYRRMGKPCARMKRTGIKQTLATKKRGVNFGVAARAGKALRVGLAKAIPNPRDRSMQSRFSGAIAKWLGVSNVSDLQPCAALLYVSSFPFTAEHTLHDNFRVPYQIDTSETGISIKLHAFVPVKSLMAPAGTISVQLVIAAAGCVLASGRGAGSSCRIIKVPYNEEEIPGMTLDFNVPGLKGNMIVTAVRMIYIGWKDGTHYIIEKKGYNSAGVINATYC